MANIIGERIPKHLLKLAARLDREIAALVKGDDPNTMFDKDQLKELGILGRKKYLAELRETRQKLGQPDDGSEE